MSDNRLEFICNYTRLAKARRWEELMEFVRLHINDAKSVLVSANAKDYEDLHNALEKE